MNANAPSVTRTLPLWIPALAAFMALVAGANGVMVWLSGRGHRDLVRPDYYEAGLAQDALIARGEGSRSWTGSVILRRSGAEWILACGSAPAGATGGTVRLYRPDDGRADREARLGGPDGSSGWQAAIPDLKRGRWIATVTWERDGLPIREGSVLLEAGN